jgi:hypothetical protein
MLRLALAPIFALAMVGCGGAATEPRHVAASLPTVPTGAAAPAAQQIHFANSHSPEPMEWTPPPPEPVEIVAPRAITWTRVSGGELQTFVDAATFHDNLAPAQNPVLARSVYGRTFSALVSGDVMKLMIVRAPDAAITMVALPGHVLHRGDLAAIAMTDRVAHVAMCSAEGGLTTVTVDLITARLIHRATLALEPDGCPSSRVVRARDRWVFASQRRGGPTARPDAFVVRTLRDGEAHLTQVIALDRAPGGDVDDFLRGAATPDGALVVVAQSGVAAVLRSGTWSTVALPAMAPRASEWPAPIAAGDQWLLSCLGCVDAPHMYTSMGARRPGDGLSEIDGTWAGPGCRGSQSFTIGAMVYMLCREALARDARSAPLANDGPRRLDGAIYDLSRGTVRPFSPPPLDELSVPGWEPNVAITIGDRLCLLGGAVSSAAQKPGGELHAAACLVPATLTWQWYASQTELGLRAAYTNGDGTFVGTRCEMVGPVDRSTTAVWCAQRKHGHDGKRLVVGPYEWTLWLAHVDD